jgi:DNA-binding IclR family transcriptional regulator
MERSLSGIGVLDKAVLIIDAIEQTPRTLGELVLATELPRATAHRLATALERHGFLDRDGDGRFRPGTRLTGPSLVAAALPVLEQLRDVTGESVQLYTRRGSRRLCLVSLESPHGLRTIVPVGALLPMNVGSAAKVLADRPDIRERGWAESVEERERGVASVSAGVHQNGSIVAAVSVSGPVDRTTRAPGRRYGKAVTTAARRIETNLRQ